MFPDAAITKAEVVGYYVDVAERMLPHLAGRPLTLQRFPQGIEASGFMQKNAADYFPDYIRRVEVPKSDGVTVYPVVDDARGIAYLANQNTVTFHVWPSLVEDLFRTDRVIFDLDPPEGDPAKAAEAARAVGHLLEAVGLPAALMTTGSKGYHVVAPVASTPQDRVAGFAQGVSELLVAEAPDRFTLEFRKAKRRGRVFMDWLRNGAGATAVAPWSLRPRPGAPVAMPISWDELEETPPGRWTLRTAVEREGDSIAELLDDPPDPAPAFAAVTEQLDAAGLELERFDRFRS